MNKIISEIETFGEEMLKYLFLLVIVGLLIWYYVKNLQFLLFIGIITSLLSAIDIKSEEPTTTNTLLLMAFGLGISSLYFGLFQRRNNCTIRPIYFIESIVVVVTIMAISFFAITSANKPNSNKSYFLEIFQNTIGKMASKVSLVNGARASNVSQVNGATTKGGGVANADVEEHTGIFMWVLLTAMYATSASNTLLSMNCMPTLSK
jgi:hypothetical protein